MINNNNLPQSSEIINPIIERFKSYDFVINGLIEGVQTLKDEIMEMKKNSDEIDKILDEHIVTNGQIYELLYCHNKNKLIFRIDNLFSTTLFNDYLDDGGDYYTTEELNKGSIVGRLIKLEEQTEQMTDLLLSIQKRLDLIEYKLTLPDTFDAEIID